MKAMPTKQKLNEIREDLQNALNEVAKKHNIETIKLGSMRYDESSFRIPLEALFEGGESPALKDLRLNAQLMGLKPEIAGANIMYANKKYTVTGMKRTKLTLKAENGKEYVATISSVVNALKLQKSPLLVEDKQGVTA